MDNGTVFAAMGAFMLVFLGLAIAMTVFWIMMIIDCATRKLSDAERVVWILVLIFLPVIGTIVYYFAVKLGKEKPRRVRKRK